MYFSSTLGDITKCLNFMLKVCLSMRFLCLKEEYSSLYSVGNSSLNSPTTIQRNKFRFLADITDRIMQKLSTCFDQFFITI